MDGSEMDMSLPPRVEAAPGVRGLLVRMPPARASAAEQALTLRNPQKILVVLLRCQIAELSAYHGPASSAAVRGERSGSIALKTICQDDGLDRGSTGGLHYG